MDDDVTGIGFLTLLYEYVGLSGALSMLAGFFLGRNFALVDERNSVNELCNEALLYCGQIDEKNTPIHLSLIAYVVTLLTVPMFYGFKYLALFFITWAIYASLSTLEYSVFDYNFTNVKTSSLLSLLFYIAANTSTRILILKNRIDELEKR